MTSFKTIPSTSITLRKVAEVTGVPYRTVSWHAEQGYLKTIHLHSQLRMTTPEWVEAWKNSGKFPRKYRG